MTDDTDQTKPVRSNPTTDVLCCAAPFTGCQTQWCRCEWADRKLCGASPAGLWMHDMSVQLTPAHSPHLCAAKALRVSCQRRGHVVYNTTRIAAPMSQAQCGHHAN
eukprot:GHRQ01029280.1.p3 GENE.GHRQ01029280.1~~GHRQ01029280.1.p3  ORF type:complete len:106 (+),score=8.81 GHRQ01029280.1:1085-1402(+)